MGLLTAGVALAMLTTGCVATPTEDASSAAAGAPRLRLALNFAPMADLSPYTDDATSLVRMGATESLITIDANGEPQPALAESFEMVDEFTAKFTLRSGVSFHDGTAVNAEAVVNSLTHAFNADPAPGTVSGRGLTAAAEGDNVVLVTSPKADPVLVMRFANPDMVILAPKAYEADANKPNPIEAGTGPFKLTALNGTTDATLEANTDYWGGAPKLSGLDVKFISEAASRVSALRAGELDVIQNVPIAQLANMDGFVVETRPIPRTTGLLLNTRSGAFTDPGLRAAAVAAIDQDVLAQTIFEDNADPAEGLFRGDTSWTADRPAPQLPAATDPANTTITIATYDDRPELPEAVTVVADQLRKAGFTVETPVVKSYAVLEAELLAGNYDAVIASRMYMSKANDPLSVIESDFTCEGGYNLSFLCDAEIDAEVAAAVGVSDVDARLAAAVAAEAKVLSTGAYIPLVHEQVRIGRTEQVSGLAEDPLEWQMITNQTTLSE